MSICRTIAHGLSALTFSGVLCAQQPSAPALQEVVVTASRLPVSPDTAGRSISLLDAETIQALARGYGADYLRYLPAVALNRQGGYGGLTQVRLRGAEANQVVVLIDGIDVSAAGTGEFDFSSLLSADLARIEVLRGPQSGLYGSNALAGVINIQHLLPTDGFKLSSTLEAGDNRTRHGQISLSAGNERLQGRMGYARRTSDFDLSEDDTIMGSENDRDLNELINAQLKWQVHDQVSLKLLARRSEKHSETDGFDFSGGPLQGLPIDDLSFSDTLDELIGLQATLTAADDRLITRLAADRATNELDGGSFGNESERRSLRLDTSWHWADQRTTVFLEHEEERFRNTYPFDASQIPQQRRDITGFGLEHRLHAGQFDASATLRRDDNDAFADSTTYALATSWQISNDTVLQASYGKGVTNPTFIEQFGFVPGTFVGNPDLKPESSKGWDASVRFRFLDGKLVARAGYFEADLSNEILSLFPSVENAAQHTSRHGWEFEASWRPSASTTVSANYTYTDTDHGDDKAVRRPRHLASAIVTQTALDERLQTSIDISYNGNQYDTDFRRFFTNGFTAEQTRLNDFVLVNARAGFALRSDLEVSLRIENMFDERYQEVIGYGSPGRALFFGIRYDLTR